MTHKTSDYFRPPQQTVIQVERPEHGDWIAWNWRTASWDHKESRLSPDGEKQDKAEK